MERGWKPNVEIAPTCPRCGSSNTKFCYYNNYSLTQPRYFCKGCRRYWTKGGSLRNVPIGGGCRKSRRSSKVVRVSANCGSGGGVASNKTILGQNGVPNNSSHFSAHDAASDIDLAVVYANFLNQKPSNRAEIPKLSGEVVNMSSFELFQGVESSNVVESMTSHLLPQDNNHHHQFVLNDGNNVNYSHTLPPLPQRHHHHEELLISDMNEINNFCSPLLPPLPGEDVTLFSNMMLTENVLHTAVQPPGIEGAAAAADMDHLNGNNCSSPFNMLENIFRP